MIYEGKDGVCVVFWIVWRMFLITMLQESWLRRSRKIAALGTRLWGAKVHWHFKPGKAREDEWGHLTAGLFCKNYNNFENYFEKYLQDFQVPLEGRICTATVSLGWGKETGQAGYNVQQISRKSNSKISLSVDEVKNVWISGEYSLDSTLWYYCSIMICGRTKPNLENSSID